MARAARRNTPRSPPSRRARVETALASLPLSLAGALKAFLLEETALDQLERAQRWPSRSGKLVLKLGLELLADHYRLA